ncbi:MAG: hypothetical protein QN183_05315 [Armatimonadota bacterium]|nr:hypothetical protein [Armatimonadota bacterium]MDR7533778.1 hypothetical protein [Armatimonadota bacterium]MDR7535768.1 hypothetical protein [Armatimonadota bacterium]
MSAARRPGDAARRLIWSVRAGVRVGRLLRQPAVSADGVEDRLRDGVARRAEHFLACAERLIFAHPHSPYRPLLEVAGYDLPALTRLVRTQGLDAALDQLRADGVYVTIQEFKGIAPAIRRGQTFRFHPRDFANPSVVGALQTTSSGSRGQRTPSAISTDELAGRARLKRWLEAHYGLAGRDTLLWRSTGTGLNWTLAATLAGQRPIRWCSQVRDAGLSIRILQAVARATSRVPLPRMEFLPAERAVDLARYIGRVNTPRGMVVETFVSSALRLVLAAEEAVIAMGDVVFIVGGEPLTPVKRREIEARGFRAISRFAFAEFGDCAWACPAGREADDLHVLTDRVAVRQHVRSVAPDGARVAAFLFTSLLPHARNVLLNVETGDSGGLEERSCGCFLERAGLRLHMHTIRSFEKLTAEGITYLGPDLVDLLDEHLPRLFGGDSRHYQLVEGEDRRGFTRLFLLVSPALGALDEEALRRTVLTEMARRHLVRAYGRVVERVWEDAGTLRVLRRDPLPTVSGKILPMHRHPGRLEEDGEGP